MANSREAQLLWEITKAMTAYGCKAGTASGCDRKGEDVSELELPYYRLIKREDERLRLEVVRPYFGQRCPLGRPHDPEKQRLAEIIDRLNDRYGAEGTDAVLDAMSDHEKFSIPLLKEEETGRQFALLILKLQARRDSYEHLW
ncbi:hypothetical protein [Halomonas urumqiensis]|uniref:Uncharacterized protein n=1 Tax=Halomonas urumqiensis TaxID=1684789 RepID=A0A2N7UCY9_9GAMM|nr:hypothetical protein [Halomonas urumqiensis]PMR78290.1 hypothetical protein C1H70_16135 [Halomonas urumqiensis]PTB03437.1 hypothetical protein C6V82_02770 [Halomonas urumqiensis]GHE20382.1 hypothetical protein GCM10017767_09030 [Halomonas urumqiensis]